MAGRKVGGNYQPSNSSKSSTGTGVGRRKSSYHAPQPELSLQYRLGDGVRGYCYSNSKVLKALHAEGKSFLERSPKINSSLINHRLNFVEKIAG